MNNKARPCLKYQQKLNKRTSKLNEVPNAQLLRCLVDRKWTEVHCSFSCRQTPGRWLWDQGVPSGMVSFVSTRMALFLSTCDLPKIDLCSYTHSTYLLSHMYAHIWKRSHMLIKVLEPCQPASSRSACSYFPRASLQQTAPHSVRSKAQTQALEQSTLLTGPSLQPSLSRLHHVGVSEVI